MKTFLKQGLLLFAFICCANAQAIPVTFDFTGGTGPTGNPLGLGLGDLGPSISVNNSGVGLTVSGTDSGAPGPSANVNRGVGGLGVVDPLGLGRVGPDESLIFDFSPASVVLLSSVILEFGSLSGALDLYIDGVFNQTIGWAVGGSGGLGNPSPLTFNGLSGSMFEFAGNTNGFRVSTITVDAEVSEPGSVVLMLLAMLTLTYARRKAVLNS